MFACSCRNSCLHADVKGVETGNTFRRRVGIRLYRPGLFKIEVFVMKKYVVALSSLLFVACSSSHQSDLTGSWVMPVPGQLGKVQGFRLEEGGKASSINMATLVYEGWKRDGDVLTVSGKSVGNRQTLPFEEKMEIEQVTKESLLLKGERGGVFRYSRAK